MRTPPIFHAALVSFSLVALLGACSSNPPVPDWQMNAKDALERSIASYLSGNVRLEAQDFEQAQREIASTGRLDLLARAELARCAGRVASLVLDDCSGFEKLRQDAAAPERAYADFLAGQGRPQDASALPAQYRAIAARAVAVGA